MSNIVGVRYIGSKKLKVDNVLNSGASWFPGQVINFDAASASRLAVHNDVWELTDVNYDAETVVLDKTKKVGGDPRKNEPAVYADVNSMGKEQLLTFARTNLLRQLPADLEENKLREEVKNLLTMSFLDDQIGLSNANKQDEGLIISLTVSLEEFNAYQAGDLVLKLVPKPAEGEQSGGNGPLAEAGNTEPNGGNGGQGAGIDSLQNQNNSLTSGNIKPTPADLDDALEQLPGEYKPEEVEGVVTQMKGYFGELFTPEVESTVRGLFKPAEQSTASNTEKTSADPQPDLKSTLELLETKALRDMVKQAGLPVSNTMTKEKLIEKLLAAAEAK